MSETAVTQNSDKRASNRRIAMWLVAVAVVVYLLFVGSGVVGSLAGG